MTANLPVLSPNTETAILTRLITAGDETSARACLPDEAARYLLSLEFQESDVLRMNQLAEKAREGALSPGEQEETDNYRHVGHLLALLRSKARRSLRSSAQ